MRPTDTTPYRATTTELLDIVGSNPNDTYGFRHAFWPFLIVDLPFTALTETLLLPVDVIQMIGTGAAP